MNQTKEILQHFSFTPEEVEIYLAVLGLEKPSVADIARKISKQRTATYFHIKKMVERGVLKETRKGRVMHFVALPPKELAGTLERFMTDFKSLIPQLDALQKVNEETPIIEVMESKSGYFKVYDEISSMPAGSTFRVMQGKYSLEKELTMLPQSQWEIFFSRVVERKIETRAIFTKESFAVPKKVLNKKNHELMSQSKRIWHLRVLSEAQLPFQQLMFIYGKKVAFMFPKTALVVTIEHSEIAEALRVVFDALWMFGDPKLATWE